VANWYSKIRSPTQGTKFFLVISFRVGAVQADRMYLSTWKHSQMTVTDSYPSRSTNPKKLFLLEGASVMVFYHSNRKVVKVSESSLAIQISFQLVKRESKLFSHPIQ
jgi:predicted 3-demethylubiquinone-9 3-methyltransferase (glyoxalase superfamily)